LGNIFLVINIEVFINKSIKTIKKVVLKTQEFCESLHCWNAFSKSTPLVTWLVLVLMFPISEGGKARLAVGREEGGKSAVCSERVDLRELIL
jgi:hypothetical protein